MKLLVEEVNQTNQVSLLVGFIVKSKIMTIKRKILYLMRQMFELLVVFSYQILTS